MQEFFMERRSTDPQPEVFITEDDPLSSNYLKDLLEDHFPQIRVAGLANSLKDARKFIKFHKVDLLFLDIELPDGKGFDLLSSMEEVNFEVIITTSHSQYALDAIRHSALDYLLKPVKLADLDHALKKFIKKATHTRPEKSIQNTGLPFIQKIPLPTSEGFVFVNTEDIVHLEADRSYSVFSLRDGKKIMVSKPMSDFEERLLRNNFYRVHNSHIINLLQVVKYVRGEGGHLVMSNDAVVPVSRSRKDDFLKIIGN
jgi:two-component system, LytTR family, response regulator